MKERKRKTERERNDNHIAKSSVVKRLGSLSPPIETLPLKAITISGERLPSIGTEHGRSTQIVSQLGTFLTNNIHGKAVLSSGDQPTSRSTLLPPPVESTHPHGALPSQESSHNLFLLLFIRICTYQHAPSKASGMS